MSNQPEWMKQLRNLSVSLSRCLNKILKADMRQPASACPLSATSRLMHHSNLRRHSLYRRGRAAWANVRPSATSQLGMELRPVGVRDVGELERGITDFAGGSNGGLIVPGSPWVRVHRELIIGLPSHPYEQRPVTA